MTYYGALGSYPSGNIDDIDSGIRLPPTGTTTVKPLWWDYELGSNWLRNYISLSIICYWSDCSFYILLFFVYLFQIKMSIILLFKKIQKFVNNLNIINNLRLWINHVVNWYL